MDDFEQGFQLGIEHERDAIEHIIRMRIASLRLIYCGIEASYLESVLDEIQKRKGEP